MINEIQQKLFEKGLMDKYDISIQVDGDNIVTLDGVVDCWQDVVDAGHATAKVDGVVNVVNNISVEGISITKPDHTEKINKAKEIGLIDSVDVLIIGAGISGCGIARELSKYDLKITVVEKGEDVSVGTTKANNGNIHPGLSVKPGTLKAKLNVRGNDLYTKWAQELDFELIRCGLMGIVKDKESLPIIDLGVKVCDLNEVPGVKKLTPLEVKEIEPNLEGELEGGLFVPSMGLVDPYKVAIALAENAIENGVKFSLNNAVVDVITEDKKIKGVITENGIIEAKYVINCAGLYADDIAEMAGDKFFTIHPRKGTIAIIDKNKRPLYNTLLGNIGNSNSKKNEDSKGGGMCKTPEGNILLGPSAKEVPYKDDLGTDPDDLLYAIERNENKEVGFGDVIKFFTGIRAADYMEDFIIGMSKKVDGFINVAAIQSPGLAAAPAIAEMVEEILVNHINENKEEDLTFKSDYNPIRKERVEFRKLSHEQQDELIQKNFKYGNIICRCETITEGEILDAIQSPLVPTTVDAIKIRTRAGMGRCQGGFCQPKIIELLARELGKEWVEINLKGEGSYILEKKNRD